MHVFVYGTLRQGQGNHGLINMPPKAVLVAELPFRMISLGAYPALIPSGKLHQITGEVYEINDNIFKRLDRLEGYPDFYDRKQFDLRPYGINDSAWFYYLKEAQSFHRSDVIDSGDWIIQKSNKERVDAIQYQNWFRQIEEN